MTTVDYAMHVATHLQQTGKLTAAKSIINAILEADPVHTYALHLSGIIAYLEGNIDTAIECIQQAITHHATEALFHTNLAELYRKNKQIELSIQHGQRAIELNPNYATAHSNLGIAYYDAKQYAQAENCHCRALAIDPTLSASLNNMGSIYKLAGKAQEAISYYQATIKIAPNAEAYYGLALIHMQKNNYADTEHFIKLAIAANPKQLEFYLLLAQLYHEQGYAAQALTYLDQAIALNPNHTYSYLSKGNILMEMGEIKAAETLFINQLNDAAIENRLFAHYCLAQLTKLSLEDVHISALLKLEKNIETHANNAEYLYFALGKYYDDLNDKRKAFHYFTKGAQLKRKTVQYNIANDIQLMQRIKKTFTKATIQALGQFANPSAKPIFIVGMPRSGTTLVEQILASHPEVHGAGELAYFNFFINRSIMMNQTELLYPDNIPYLTAKHYHDISHQYLQYLQTIAPNANYVTDKMPQNFIAIGLIHALLPNAKIIHVKRDPIDTCLSCYTKLFTKGHDYSYDLTELGQYYQCYESIMNHWREVLPDHSWLDIQYEDVIANTESATKALLNYCHLPWHPDCLNFHNAKRTIRTASFMQVRQPVYTTSINRWQYLTNELKPLIAALSNNKHDQTAA